jgi:hypothetical protein
MACVECSCWSFKMKEENGLPESNSVWHSIRFGHRTSSSCCWRFDWREWWTRRLWCVLYWSFLLRPHWRRVDMIYELFQVGDHTLCWYGERFCLWALSGINTVLFLVCIIWNCNFLYCNYFLVLSVTTIHLPKLGTNVRLIRRGEFFKEMNFTRVFLFLMYDVYVITVSSLIK